MGKSGGTGLSWADFWSWFGASQHRYTSANGYIKEPDAKGKYVRDCATLDSMLAGELPGMSPEVQSEVLERAPLEIRESLAARGLIHPQALEKLAGKGAARPSGQTSASEAFNDVIRAKHKRRKAKINQQFGG